MICWTPVCTRLKPNKSTDKEKAKSVTTIDENDLHQFNQAIAEALSALMRAYKRAEKEGDGLKMSQALRVQEMLQKSGRVMAAICSET